MNSQTDRFLNNRIKVLYIAGSGRSGSTLLERILGQMEAMVSIGELRHIWLLNKSDLCGCGNSLSTCNFWGDIFGDAFGGIETIDFGDMKKLRLNVDRIRYIPQMLSPILASHEFRENFARYSQVIRKIYQTISKKYPGKIIIDSSKDISSLFLASTLPDVDLYILNLVRDSRGVAYSWNRRQKLRPEITDREVYMRTHKPSKIAWEWTYRNIFVQHARKRVKGYTLIKYEDFIGDPQKSLRQIMTFLDLKDDGLDFISENKVALDTVNHTVSGNPIRFNNGEVQLRLDKEWISNMVVQDKFVVTLLTWPYLLKYGYPIISSSSLEHKGNPKQ